MIAWAQAGELQCLRFPRAAFAVGDALVIVAVPHEPSAAYQLGAERISPFRQTMVLGYTGGCESYLATADAYRMGSRGGYEASPQGAAFFYKHRLACKPEVEEQVHAGVAKIFQDLQTA